MDPVNSSALTWYEWTVIAVIAYLAFCPPRYDPAIQLRLWLEKRRGK